MKNWRGLLLLVCLIVLPSCGEDDETNSSGLSIQVGGRPPVIPFAGVDCYSQQINPAYFKLTDFQINWTRTDAELTIFSVRFEMRASALEGEFVQVMDADTIARYMVTLGGQAIEGGVIPAATTSDSGAAIRDVCQQPLDGGGNIERPGNLPVFGINLPEGTRNFQAQVRVIVQGIATGINTDNEGEEEPVRASATFGISYDFN